MKCSLVIFQLQGAPCRRARERSDLLRATSRSMRRESFVVVLCAAGAASALAPPVAARAHADRIARLLGGVEPAAAAKASVEDPFLNFVFAYYGRDLGEPGALAAYSPGVAGGGAAGLRAAAAAAPEKRVAVLREDRAILAATARAPPVWNCYGLHEWAMLYRGGAAAAAPPRHQSLPTRLDQGAIDAAVEAADLRCSHYDAFRFFTDAAKPRNGARLVRADRLTLEQPACLHANMDLLRYALRLAPFGSSAAIADCLELALDAREVDMRASPYDLSGAVDAARAAPIAVETADGRAEYVRRQTAIAHRGADLRRRLLDEYDAFFLCRALGGAATGAAAAARAAGAAPAAEAAPTVAAADTGILNLVPGTPRYETPEKKKKNPPRRGPTEFRIPISAAARDAARDAAAALGRRLTKIRGCAACDGSEVAPCPSCDGAGAYVARGARFPCRSCDGSGQVVCRACFTDDPYDLEGVRARARRRPD